MSVSFVRKLYGILRLRCIRRLIITPLKAQYHRYKRSAIIQRISRTKKITIVFFPINLAMWKYDMLVEQLSKDERFHIYIVPSLSSSSPTSYNQKLQDEMRAYFQDKRCNFIDGYDFKANEFFDPISLHPDIVVFTQPYNVGHRYYKLEHFWSTSLFIYTPYGIQIENNPHFYNSLLQQISWKYFCATELNRQDVMKYSLVKGENAIVSGAIIEDAFRQSTPDYRNIWKQKDEYIKRIIWAPHHSINSDDTLNNSTFLTIAEGMLRILERYNGRIQFAFKPHPALKQKLYSLPTWGPDRTDEYYAKWANASNSIIAEGKYVELFLTSDAMIHDCSSFTGEYLYVNRPVMFLSKKDHVDQLNELGRLCYKQHYKGSSLNDVERFLNDVILDDNDRLYIDRTTFVEKYLTCRGGTVAKHMYREIASLID